MAMADIKSEKNQVGKGKPGPGRPKGMPNKTTALIKDAIIQAAERAGGAGGMVAYLEDQATKSPAAFLSLLGKVLPTQVEGPNGSAVVTQIVLRAYDGTDN